MFLKETPVPTVLSAMNRPMPVSPAPKTVSAMTITLVRMMPAVKEPAPIPITRIPVMIQTSAHQVINVQMALVPELKLIRMTQTPARLILATPSPESHTHPSPVMIQMPVPPIPVIRHKDAAISMSQTALPVRTTSSATALKPVTTEPAPMEPIFVPVI